MLANLAFSDLNLNKDTISHDHEDFYPYLWAKVFVIMVVNRFEGRLHNDARSFVEAWQLNPVGGFRGSGSRP
jgi:hypothetical protein